MKQKKNIMEMGGIKRLSEEELALLRNQSYRDAVISYTLMNASDFFLRRAHKAMSKIRPELKQKKKLKASRMQQMMGNVIKEFDLSTISVDQAFFEQLGGQAYDVIRHNSNELVRFVQLYYEKCWNEKSALSIERSLMKLTGQNLFTEEEIESINLE